MNSRSLQLYLGWLVELEAFYKVIPTVAAISLKCREIGIEDISADNLVGDIKKAAERVMGEKKSSKEERLPFPIQALRHFRLFRPVDYPIQLWRRDSALMMLGLRCMRRANELAAIRRKHITRIGEKFFLKVPSQKNDQKAVGVRIAIEPSGDPLTCPVLLLEEYLASKIWEPGDFLFTNSKGGQISSGAISKLVKRMVESAGFEGRYSSHSLRIGGATAAMEGGLTLEQIMSIGNWRSESAATMYLRALGAAKSQASVKMGF